MSIINGIFSLLGALVKAGNNYVEESYAEKNKASRKSDDDLLSDYTKSSVAKKTGTILALKERGYTDDEIKTKIAMQKNLEEIRNGNKPL